MADSALWQGAVKWISESNAPQRGGIAAADYSDDPEALRGNLRQMLAKLQKGKSSMEVDHLEETTACGEFSSGQQGLNDFTDEGDFDEDDLYDEEEMQMDGANMEVKEASKSSKDA